MVISSNWLPNSSCHNLESFHQFQTALQSSPFILTVSQSSANNSFTKKPVRGPVASPVARAFLTSSWRCTNFKIEFLLNNNNTQHPGRGSFRPQSAPFPTAHTHSSQPNPTVTPGGRSDALCLPHVRTESQRKRDPMLRGRHARVIEHSPFAVSWPHSCTRTLGALDRYNRTVRRTRRQ